MKRSIFFIFCSCFLLLTISTALQAQDKILGKITTGMSENDPVDNIMVEASSGATAFTNSDGFFSIAYQLHDTLSFYYQGKKTVSFLTDTIDKAKFYVPLYKVRNRVMEGAKTHFNKALLPSDTSNNNVTVTARDYSRDSLERRKEYGDAFNYEKPKMKYGKDWSPTSLNVGKLYETLNTSKKKKNEMLKKNLLDQEQEGYVNTRFNRTFITKYLGEKISEQTLEDFMKKKRPRFEEIQGMSDFEMIDYIRRAYSAYKRNK